MFGRLIGLAVSFAIIVYLLMGVIGGEEKIEQSIEQNEAVQDQKAALESAGIDASNKEELKKALTEQAEAYKKQQEEMESLLENR